MTPEIIKFEPEHLRLIERRENKDSERIEREMRFIDQHFNVAFSGVIDGKLFGAAGMFIGITYREQKEVIRDPRAGYVWLVVSDEISGCKLWFHKQVLKYFHGIVRNFDLRRIESEVAEDSKRNRRWIEALGFRLTDPIERATASDGGVCLRYVYEATECRV